MKKLGIFLISLVFMALSLFAADGNSSSASAGVNKSVLSLIIPSDTLTLKFASDSSGTEISGTKKLFTLNKHSEFSTGFDTAAGNTTAAYVTSAVEFYVVYQAMVTKDANIVITVPTSFKSSTTTDSVPVQVDKTRIDAGSGTDAATILTSGDNAVVTIKNDKVYNGYLKCILALDMTNAKKGLTYTGNVTMKVVAAS